MSTTPANKNEAACLGVDLMQLHQKFMDMETSAEMELNNRMQQLVIDRIDALLGDSSWSIDTTTGAIRFQGEVLA